MAANSSVEVVNMALAMLGARPIAALDEGTQAASLAREFFDTERDAALAAHPWNFALKRLSLARDAVAPVFGFDYSYQLPSDYLRVLAVNPDCEYVVEGRKLLCDELDVSIRYIRRVSSPAEWSDLFKSTFAARLAWKMAYPLTEQVSVADRMEKAYAAKLNEARSIDSQEGSPVDLVVSPLTDVRTRSWWGWRYRWEN